MEMKEGRVLISKKDYDELIKKSRDLDILTKVLYESSTLSWRAEELRFDSDLLTQYLRATNRIRYMEHYYYLVEEKRAKEAEDREKVID